MSKNLYILECPAASEFDNETEYTNKIPGRNEYTEYIKLIPLDYFRQTANKINHHYTTNNPNVFWAKPD